MTIPENNEEITISVVLIVSSYPLSQIHKRRIEVTNFSSLILPNILLHNKI